MVARDRFKYWFKISGLKLDSSSFLRKISKMSLKDKFNGAIELETLAIHYFSFNLQNTVKEARKVDTQELNERLRLLTKIAIPAIVTKTSENTNIIMTSSRGNGCGGITCVIVMMCVEKRDIETRN